MLSIVQDIKTTTPSRGSEKGFLLSCPDLKSSFSAEHRASPSAEPRTHCSGHSWPGNGHPSPVATPSELIPVGEPETGGTSVAHAPGACEGLGRCQMSHSAQGSTHPGMRPPNRGRLQMSRSVESTFFRRSQEKSWTTACMCEAQRCMNSTICNTTERLSAAQQGAPALQRNCEVV